VSIQKFDLICVSFQLFLLDPLLKFPEKLLLCTNVRAFHRFRPPIKEDMNNFKSLLTTFESVPFFEAAGAVVKIGFKPKTKPS